MYSSTVPGRSQWWAEEFERLKPALRSFLLRRAVMDATSALEIVDGIPLELMRRFQRSPGVHPNWFKGKPPSAMERARFHSLVWVIAKRRFYDLLRTRYFATRHLHSQAVASAQSIEALIDARRLLAEIARLVAALSGQDREILIRASEATPADPAGLTNRERQRLLRVRRHLARALENAVRPKLK